MGYILDGKFTQTEQHDNLRIDRELAFELAEAFKRKTGMEFRQSRFMLLTSEEQNNLVRVAGIAAQTKRRRRKVE